MELLISIVVGVLMVEAYAWLPKVSEWLIERAVSQLLAEHQARCREEWKASLDALPNSGIKLLHAFSFLCWGADRINADSIEAELEQIGRQLEELSATLSCNLQELHTVKIGAAQRQVSRQQLAHFLDESVASLRAIKVPASHATGHAANAAPSREVVNALEELGRTLVLAVNRAGDLTDSRVHSFSARMEQGERQVRTIFAKHADAIELFRKRRLSPTKFTLVLNNLHDDLQKLRAMVEGQVVDDEDEVRKRQYERIMTALASVLASDWARAGKAASTDHDRQ